MRCHLGADRGALFEIVRIKLYVHVDRPVTSIDQSLRSISHLDRSAPFRTGGRRAFDDYSLTAPFPPTGPPNRFVRGKPFGATRPASARLPFQSASSLRVSENARPAVSVQVRPSAALKVF